MEANELTENIINAREIIANLLSVLGINAPELARQTGIGYMRYFDLQRGRVKKFNPAVVDAICRRYPRVNKNYLYTGEGNVLLDDGATASVEAAHVAAPAPSISDAEVLKQVLNKDQYLEEKARLLEEKARQLETKERELHARELDIVRREAELGILNSPKREAM